MTTCPVLTCLLKKLSITGAIHVKILMSLSILTQKLQNRPHHESRTFHDMGRLLGWRKNSTCHLD
jgi:hypothetical protein